MAGWIKAMDAAALPAHGMKRVEPNGVPILLVHSGERLRAFGADCPHAGAPLDEGALCNGRIVCPWHKATFEIEDGALVEPPALEGLASYAVRVDGDQVLVNLDNAQRPAAERKPAANRAASNATPPRRFAIVGGGAAGAAVAATLLEGDANCEVTLYAAEPEAPYDRTCLSKFVPAGEMQPGEVPPILPDAIARDARLHIEHAGVEQVDARAKRISSRDGRAATYDAVALASGSVAQRPDVPGAELGNIFTLRNVHDAGAILHALAPGEHAVILGDSFIGLETASALRKRGVDVTVVAPSGLPLQKPLGARVGARFREWHEAHGVVFRRAKAVGFIGENDVDTIELDDGWTTRAKAVIVGMGVQPATGFVGGIVLDDDGGLSVDNTMRACPDVYAVGDIARFPWGGKTLRIEHWRVAQQQARVAALNMLGRETRYEGVPYFWTQHYDQRVDYLGHAADWDDLVMQGKPGDARFGVLYVRSGRVLAVLACGYERETAELSERMRERLSVDTARDILGFQ
ncbi:FAD-dependent oxidoreductase [Paraburkholderia acidisoli]|uniref:Rieske 2Fe-2S domain-containing protein n=1 Tax=Paraburkholderia acidisoli TaxID=2571748 RepID=A0A7Z2GNK1_9BURK|nr:FAD-dependent oxidoreductase [Paraburkholderia acidisoli]QGZ64889.1 Rieske 2Fe-2S domain-containing protein [Paraburkholderia acidisoli]